MTRTRNPNHAIAATVAAVALLAFAGTWSFEEVPLGLPGLGAVEFPRLICLVLLGLAGLLAMVQAEPYSAEDVPPIGRGAWAIFGACALFLPVMELVGIFGAIPLFLIVAGRLWGDTDMKPLVLSALGLTLGIWLVFVGIFKLKLPSGLLGAALGF
jgi:hypothetical protein